MKSETQATPLACNMNVFTPTQRNKHVQGIIELLRSVQGTHEVTNGFEFSFPNATSSITKLAEFISNERLCCPFLEFTLSSMPNDEPISLTLTGPEGTPEFLHAEFTEAFA